MLSGVAGTGSPGTKCRLVDQVKNLHWLQVWPGMNHVTQKSEHTKLSFRERIRLGLS